MSLIFLQELSCCIHSLFEGKPWYRHWAPVANPFAMQKLFTWDNMTVWLYQDESRLQHVDEVLKDEKRCAFAFARNHLRYLVVKACD